MTLREATVIVQTWYEMCDEAFTDEKHMALQHAWVNRPSDCMAKVELYRQLLRVRFNINL